MFIQKKQRQKIGPDLVNNDEFKGKYHVPSNLGGGTNRSVSIWNANEKLR